MPGTDFIPHGGPPFSSWEKNFVDKVNLYKGGWDFTARANNEWILLTSTANTKRLRWTAAWAIVSTKVFNSAEEIEMLDARRDYESGRPNDPNDTSIRLFIKRYIRNNPLVTNAQKISCGLIVPVLDATETTEANSKLSEEIALAAKHYAHLEHIVGVIFPGKKSKALGKGIEEISIFIAITEPGQKEPPPISAFKYDGKASRSLYKRTFSEDQITMRAWYYACKKMKGKRSKYGKPSAIICMVIP